MSDFLSRLAERALGVAPMVQPLVDSRYAAGPGDAAAAAPGFTETHAEREAVPSAASGAAPAVGRPAAPGPAAAAGSPPAPPAAEAGLREVVVETAAPPRAEAAGPPPAAGPEPEPARGEALLLPRPAQDDDAPRPVRGEEEGIREVRARAGPRPAPAVARADPATATATAGTAAGAREHADTDEDDDAVLMPLRPGPDEVLHDPGGDGPPRVVEAAVDAAGDAGSFAAAHAAGPRPHPAARRPAGVRLLPREERREPDGGARPGAALAAAARPPAAETGDARPVVRVTIGRVEVRAVAPPAAPAQPAPRPSWTPPLLSLDDYLRRDRP